MRVEAIASGPAAGERESLRATNLDGTELKVEPFSTLPVFLPKTFSSAIVESDRRKLCSIRDISW
jgi:hypothetical protein